MGGIKHAYHEFGGTPASPNNAENIFERDLQLRMRALTPYCQFCGNEIIDYHIDEFGMRVDTVWERTNQMHYRCLLKEQQGRR